MSKDDRRQTSGAKDTAGGGSAPGAAPAAVQAPQAPAPAKPRRLARVEPAELERMTLEALLALAEIESLPAARFRTRTELLALLVDAKAGGTGGRYVHGHTRCEVCMARVDVTGTSRIDGGQFLVRSVRCRGDRRHTYQIAERVVCGGASTASPVAPTAPAASAAPLAPEGSKTKPA